MTLVAVMANTDSFERRNCTPGSLHGHIYARTMADADLLAAASDDGYNPQTQAYKDFLTVMGPNTNRTWITSTCAVVAYDRGLIDEYELDRITR